MFGKGECGGHGGGHFGGAAGMGGPFAAMLGKKCGPGAVLEAIDLTDDQLLRIAELKGKAFGKIARSKIDLMELKKEIFKELLQPQVDRNKINGIVQQIKDLKSACGDTILENMIAFSELITAEQKKKLRISLVRKFLGVDELYDDE